MLNETDYQEAVRRYKNMKVNGHERQRHHALILVHQGYSYREVGQILLVDEGTIGRWVTASRSLTARPHRRCSMRTGPIRSAKRSRTFMRIGGVSLRGHPSRVQ